MAVASFSLGKTTDTAPSSVSCPFHCAHRLRIFDWEGVQKNYGVERIGVGMMNGVSVGKGVAVPCRVGSGVAVG